MLSHFPRHSNEALRRQFYKLIDKLSRTAILPLRKSTFCAQVQARVPLSHPHERQIPSDNLLHFLHLNPPNHIRFWLFQGQQWPADIEALGFVAHQAPVGNLLIVRVLHQFRFPFVRIALGFLPIVRWRFQLPFFVLPNARKAPPHLLDNG